MKTERIRPVRAGHHPERTTIRADVKAMFGLMTVHGTFRLHPAPLVPATNQPVPRQ
jgi:hypothetical protein